MLIKWNGKGPLSLILKASGSKPKILVPGVNKFTKEEWEEFKEHPHIKRYMEEKPPKFELVSEKEPKPEEKAAAEEKGEAVDLSQFSNKDAKEVIEETLNVELLKEWKKTENRKSLVAAIDKQLDSLIIKDKKDK